MCKEKCIHIISLGAGSLKSGNLSLASAEGQIEDGTMVNTCASWRSRCQIGSQRIAARTSHHSFTLVGTSTHIKPEPWIHYRKEFQDKPLGTQGVCLLNCVILIKIERKS